MFGFVSHLYSIPWRKKLPTHFYKVVYSLKWMLCLFAVIQSWSPYSPSTLTRPTASASSSTPWGNTSPQEVPTPSSVCGTWTNWCVCAASPGQSVFVLMGLMFKCHLLVNWWISWHDNMTRSTLVNHHLMCHRLDWPVRTLSFSHDGKMLASASEDHFIDIAEVETGQCDRLWVFVCCISQRSSHVLHQF